VTLVLAHRGANRELPENTVAAFRRALALGADGVELDVQRTADDQLVVCHDAATPAGSIGELTVEQACAALPGLPTLAEVLDASLGRLVNVEMKNLPWQAGFDPDDRLSDLVVALLRERGGVDDVVVSSFNLESIDRVRAAAPEVATGFLVMGGDPVRALEWAAERGHSALHPAVAMLDGAHLGEVVTRAHGAGVAVNVWTVNDVADLIRLRDAGVNAVITDDPALARAAYGAPPA